MKNYFYTTEIADAIKKLLDKKLPDEVAENISTGDFTVLPAPENLDEYLPAVIISISDKDVDWANVSLGISTQQDAYDIYYLYPYTFKEFEDTPKKATANAEAIANILINYGTLNDFTIEPTDTEAGGQVITSAVTSLSFDNAETEIFRALEIPASIVHIKYHLAFRTFRG